MIIVFSQNILKSFIIKDNKHLLLSLKKVFFIYAKQLKRKKLYYFMKYIVIALILKYKNNQLKRYSYNENTFNKLYNDYILRNRKKEKLKNNYLMKESEFFPYSPRFTYSGYFGFPQKVFPSLNNYGKKYFNLNKTQKRNITDDYKNSEKDSDFLYLNRSKGINGKYPHNNYDKKYLCTRINKNINEQISNYLNNFDLIKKKHLLNRTNPNIQSFLNYNNLNKYKEKPSFIKSNKSKTKKENNKIKFNSNKSLNPSSFNGLEQINTQYTTHQRNSYNNIKSGINILSNVNSLSSRINETNNNSHFLNGIKMISGVNEFFYDFNSGNRNNSNKIEQKNELSIQTLNDSKLLELASKYVNEEDNSSENYQMINILHNKKRFNIKNIS